MHSLQGRSCRVDGAGIAFEKLAPRNGTERFQLTCGLRGQGLALTLW